MIFKISVILYNLLNEEDVSDFFEEEGNKNLATYFNRVFLTF